MPVSALSVAVIPSTWHQAEAGLVPAAPLDPIQLRRPRGAALPASSVAVGHDRWPTT